MGRKDRESGVELTQGDYMASIHDRPRCFPEAVVRGLTYRPVMGVVVG